MLQFQQLFYPVKFSLLYRGTNIFDWAHHTICSQSIKKFYCSRFIKRCYFYSEYCLAEHIISFIFWRHALEDSLERAYRPAIAAVLAFIDPHDNLKLSSNPTTTDIWMKLFMQSDQLGLTFERLTKVAAGQMPTSVRD